MDNNDLAFLSPEYPGLSEAEVRARTERGETNVMSDPNAKTVWQIVRSNALTLFNLIFLILAVVLCLVGSYRSLTFVPLVVLNTLVGIVQELRARHVLNQMSLLNAPHALAVRGGVQRRVAAEELVKDDVVILSAGDQICADARVLNGTVQVNEALLTGESDEIEKTDGQTLLSGSFVVSGQCYAQLEKVGDESYIAGLTRQAKAEGKKEPSEMIRAINKIVQLAGFAVIPIGVILFCQGYYLNGETIRKSVVSTVAAILGMIPEGLYMLTTIALVLGTLRLAKSKVLLHDMRSIETLARVDVLCVDKTGTITEPEMKLGELLPLGETGAQALSSLVCDYALSTTDNNATMQALRTWARQQRQFPERACLGVTGFSSSAKYGAVRFEDGEYRLGAPEFVLPEMDAELRGQVQALSEKGLRVLLLARFRDDGAQALGLLTLENPIRQSAKQTFAYFAEQGVAVKVISGDNPQTVSRVAQEAGIAGAERCIDAALLDTEEKIARACELYTVFGRVTPKQKQQLVHALQAAGHTVAMTGDGVNDILAMKDADCSVAMASGSEAAAQCAQVVLMESDFSRMPDVVLEGRRVVNNIERSASLFLVKNIFSLLMSLFSALFRITYPLEPSQLTLISSFTIGIPGFLLALEPNRKRIEGRFLKNVLLKALPAGLTDALAVGALMVCGTVFGIPDDDIATASTMLLCVVGFMILIRISRPFTPMKYGILAFNVLGLAVCGVFLHQLFALSAMSEICVLLMIVFAFSSESLFRNLGLLTEAVERRLAARRSKRSGKADKRH